MRKGIRYALILTLISTVWTFWKGMAQENSAAVPVHPPLDAYARLTGESHTPSASVPPSQGASSSLPPHWVPSSVAQATRNPFIEVPDVAPPPPVPKPEPKITVQEPPPVHVPPLAYRLVGKVVGVNGLPVLFLQKGELVIEARPGVVLDDGYSVEEVGKNSVSVVHSVSGFHTTLNLPDIPE